MKNNADLNDYIILGAKIRLIKSLVTSASRDMNNIGIGKNLMPFRNKIYLSLTVLSSKLDSIVWREYGKDINKLKGSLNHVFYGLLDRAPIDDIDRQVLEAAKKIAAEITKEASNEQD